MHRGSQAGVIGLTKTVAREFAGRGVTCNAVAPGFIASDMTAAIDSKYEEKILSEIPLGAIPSPLLGAMDQRLPVVLGSVMHASSAAFSTALFPKAQQQSLRYAVVMVLKDLSAERCVMTQAVTDSQMRWRGS